MPRAVARLSLLEGRPSSSRGHPSSPTMRSFVRFVTAGLGVPPRWRTSSNASARLMQASRPVKATEDLSAEPSSSTDIMLASLLASPLCGGAARLSAWGRGFLFLSIDAGAQGIHEIDYLRRRTFLYGFNL